MNFEYCEGRVHVIKEGDTLYQLSRQHNVPLALILRANPFTDVYNLQVGDEICIPTMIGRPPERPEMSERPNVPEEPGMPNRPQQPEAGMPGMSNRPQQPEAWMPGMSNRPQQPETEMPGMSNRPQQPEAWMPGMSNRPQQPETGIPGMSNRPQQPEAWMPGMSNRPQQPEAGMPGMSGALERPERLITMPQFPNLFMYTVENDDSLEDILDEFEISLEDLLNFNDLEDMMLLPGSVIRVPARRRRDDD